MQGNDKAITSLVRSMKRTLQTEHGITVPHSALRASFLRAHGENPHAFAGRVQASEQKTVEVTASVAEAPTQTYTLYLADTDAGCLERFALDADGTILLPEDFEFKGAKLEHQYAEVPSVNRYGLPDYLVKAKEFYAAFGLELSPTHEFKFHNLGDDSGDSCKLQISMTDLEWQAVLAAALGESPDFAAEVAEWVGVHYQHNFDKEPELKKLEWAHRYLEVLEQESRQVPVRFEWVYPDEDSDHVDAYVDIDTGTIVLEQEAADDVTNSSVRIRIWVPNYGDELDEAMDGEMYDAYFKRGADGKDVFFVQPKAISAIAREYGITV